MTAAAATALAIACWCPAALAHDPGLSSASVRAEAGVVVVELTFARADVESLVRIDRDRDGVVSAREWEEAAPALTGIARGAAVVEIDGRRLEAGVASTERASGNDDVTLRMRFEGAGGSRLHFRSELIPRLPRGHRQFVSVSSGGAAVVERLLHAASPVLEADLSRPSHEGAFDSFFVLGIEHILTGYDHLLFLLALLVAVRGIGQAVKLITAFTVAHSFTLALATLDVVQMPASIVEPFIAASIIYVAVENLLGLGGRHRWLVTFAFGLVHGFGFAGVLRELGIGEGGSAAVPLLAFNLGVEAGQIAVAAVSLPLLLSLARGEVPRARFACACSLLVAAAGCYWLLERTLVP